MNKIWKHVLVVIFVVTLVFLVCFAGIRVCSGMDNPATTVVSGSMEHSDKSTIGIIDTGDTIVMKSKSQGITTYADGFQNGHSTFGEYGDVIIYDRPGSSSVIHRAIVYLEYNSDGTYSAPSLKDKDKGEIWSSPLGYRMDPGKLWWTDTGTNSHFTKLAINLPVGGTGEYMALPFESKDGKDGSGFLTKGDSKNNMYFDCRMGISDGLVRFDDIRGVADLEIPWIGTIKLFAVGSTSDIQDNTVLCLVFEILDFLALLVIIILLFDILERRLAQKDR